MVDTEKFQKRIVVTGGAGFIGSNLLLYLVPKYPDYLFVNVDCLTYAGNLTNLRPIESAPNYIFEKINICDRQALEDCFQRYDINAIIHLAAESHVDRSITGPAEFVNTNVIGTFNLLELARQSTEETGDFRFHHVSTDEVYGSLGATGMFTEKTPFDPRSPYSASKASSDHLVNAYFHTYDMPILITNCSNNYGPYQFPEKLIPLIFHNSMNGKALPIYGDGKYVRDWLYVKDHCEAIVEVLNKGTAGQSYNIGGNNEKQNLEVVTLICDTLDKKVGLPQSGEPRKNLMVFVKDRLGHDRRYAIDASFIKEQIGWEPKITFEVGIEKTVDWYLANQVWVDAIIDGSYRGNNP